MEVASVPQTDLPAIMTSATRRMIQRRLLLGWAAVVMALGAVVGAVAVVHHRRAREQVVQTRGVAVQGIADGPVWNAGAYRYWTENASWVYRGVTYHNDSVLPSRSGEGLPPPGAGLAVIVDPDDPSFARVDGSYTQSNGSTWGLTILLLIAFFTGIFGPLALWNTCRQRSVVHTAAWVPARVAGIVPGTAGRNRRMRVTELVGDDPRFPVYTNARRFPTGEAWVAFGERFTLITRPGGGAPMRWARQQPAGHAISRT